MSTPSGISVDSAFGDLAEDKLVELVRVAETAERYEDMCKFVRKLVEVKSSKGQDLDVEERNLLSVAYKNVVGSKRASWRTLSGGFDDADEALIEKYKSLVERELENVCMEVNDLLQKHLIKNVEGKNDETEVFYLKMAGDYYRYLAEFRPDSDYKNKSKEFYGKAMEKSNCKFTRNTSNSFGISIKF